jgi:cobalt-precorrin-5B (C1)-methyltransferase
MSRKPEGPLRRGWTTGACATAAAKAACTALLTGAFPDPVTIRLPRGEEPTFALAREELGETFAQAGIVKDAGDDPDVTHQALIQARVSHGAIGSGVIFKAGPGVGTVTKPGLPLAVGEPAINPVPRKLMREAVEEVACAQGITADLEIEISVPGGEALAERTWNPRLGILGGISILGTTGVVVPYSCSAWIYSIHQGIDVARATGLAHVAGCTGSTSQAAVQALYDLDDTALLDMGDFAGGLLKYLRKHPLPKLTIAGGFGKLSKLAAGYLDLHSGRSQVDFDHLAALADGIGAATELRDAIAGAETALQALELAEATRLPLADAVARDAQHVASDLAAPETEVEVLIFDRAGRLRGRSHA